jgi:hypothetical protein
MSQQGSLIGEEGKRLNHGDTKGTKISKIVENLWNTKEAKTGGRAERM